MSGTEKIPGPYGIPGLSEKIHVPDGDPAKTQRLYVFDAKARSCPDCHSIGAPQDGCEHPWHTMGIHPYPEARHCADEVLCVNQCASGPCSRECQVCRRLAWSGESGPPCPACPDSPKKQAGRAAREGRCPDGGYCHGSNLAAGSPPCAPGLCWRVQTSGPLSGVFPGDRWPPRVIAEHHPKDDGHVCGRQGCVLPAGHNQGNADVPVNHQPGDADLRKAVAMSSEAARCFRVAITTDDPHAIEAHLALAASLAQDAVRIAVRAHQNLTGEETIRFQGQVYTQ